MNQMNDDVLVRCEHVSKKFCRELKRSLWYGVQDICAEINPLRKNDAPLGKENIPELRKDEFWAVNDISFELKRGECLGLIGHNGAGKSTLLKMLNGLIKPDHGRITMKGRIGALIELNAGFNPILTGRENVYIYGTILGFTKKEIDSKYEAIVEFAEMAEFMEMPFRSYSSGMKVRLGFAVAAQMEPDVLIIDEVLAVGDVGFRVKCLNRIHELLGTSAVIFVSHAMPFVARICSHVMVMRNGKDKFSSSDVASGIDFYHSEFSMGEGTISGSGEAEIRSLLINGEDGNILPVVPFGENLQLKIELGVYLKHSNLGSRLQIYDANQIPVLDIVTGDYQSFTWQNHSESVLLTIDVPNLRLSEGKHSVAIIIYEQETTRILCRMDNAVSFIMGHHISTGCLVLQEAKWLML